MTTESQIVSAKAYLNATGIFIGKDDDDEDWGNRFEFAINLNDAFYWACSDCEMVEDNEMPELARLHKWYGWCGVLYWVLKKRGETKVEFADVNRHVEFVRNEEAIREEAGSSSKYAYLVKEYTIGKPL